MTASALGDFRRYWSAAAISSCGSAVTTVALPVLLVRQLRLSPTALGAVNAAQFLPYAVLGLVAGVFVDRWSRRRVLVWSSLGRAASLGAIPACWALDFLPLWLLVGLLVAFGAFSVFGFAATQSLLPRLVPPEGLVAANARLDQTDTAAQTIGPLVGGGLVGVVGAPLALALDALSYLVDAVLNHGLRVTEPARVGQRRRLLAEAREGLAWAYGHRTLGPLALSTHVWFLANAASTTALAVIALRTIGLTPLLFSVLLTTSGGAALAGATAAAALGGRWGSERVVVAARACYPLAWLLLGGFFTSPVRVPLLFLTLILHGLAAGVENANEMGLWQAATPDSLLGRVNASRRAVNRSVAMLGALLGGLALSSYGERLTLLAIGLVFAVAAAVAAAALLRAEPVAPAG